MALNVQREAAEWYKEEMGLEDGDFVQFFLKIYGGIPTAHPNYFLGISVGKKGNIKVKDEKAGITFYFNEEDAWFLDQFDMEVTLKDDDVEYVFHERWLL